MFMFAGFKLVTSGGNEAAKTAAKVTFYNVIIGYLILLAGWLMVDTLLKATLDDQAYGMWRTIQCVSQPTVTPGRLTATGDNSRTLAAGDVDQRVRAIQAAGAVREQVREAGRQANLTPEQIAHFEGLIMQESGMCRSLVGPSTRYGQAQGCGQLLLTTARQFNSSVTEEQLRTDHSLNLSISAQYFAQQLQANNGNLERALAAYNGGPGANRPSQHCPGLAAWQCEWDSSGCHNTGRTDCVRNTGANSYAQTRHYVTNITNMANRLSAPTN
jgi:hypothetical protein